MGKVELRGDRQNRVSARGAVSTVWWPDGLLTESGHRLRYLHSFVLRSLKIKPIKEMLVLRIFCESDRSPRRAEGAGATPCGGAAVAGGGVGGVDDPRASHGREERLREDTGEVRAKAAEMKARVD